MRFILLLAALVVAAPAAAQNQPFGLGLGISQTFYEQGAASFESDTEPYLVGVMSLREHLSLSGSIAYQLTHGNTVSTAYLNYTVHDDVQRKASVGVFLGHKWVSDAESGINEFVLGPALGWDALPFLILTGSAQMGLDSGGVAYSIAGTVPLMKASHGGGY